MTRSHPRLVLVEGTEADAQRIRQALGTEFRVELAPQANPASPSEDSAPDTSPDQAEMLDRVDSNHARTLLRCLGEGICLGSPEGRILWANDYYRAFSEGCKKQIEIVSRESAGHLTACLRASPDVTPASLSCKFDVACEESGRSFDVFVTPVVAAGAKGELASIAVVARDVTDARRAQRKMDAIDHDAP